MRRVGLLVAAITLAVGGCGQKGPLYLPDKNAKVVTSPAPTSTPPAASPAATPKPKANSQDQDSPPPQQPQSPQPQ
jgi:predicted small lipoprotein YifL